MFKISREIYVNRNQLYIGSVMSLLSAFAGVSVFLDIYLAISNRDNLTFLDSLRVVLASVSMLYLLLIVKSDPPKRRIYKPAVSSSRFSHSVYYVMGLAACLVLLGLFPDISGSGILYEHPIDALIYIADQGHEAWAMQAKQSRTLEEAITNYQQRYNRKPPPNFHIWYNFAIARNSDVIDDFDNIERDLAPFRTLDPGELRERTKEAVYDEYNEIGVIKIRGGKAIVDKRFEGHRWMMDVMVLMMEYFTFSLPDMDIPFNINDEPRVVVPYKEMQKLLSRQAPSLSDKLGKNWSMNTGDLLDESVADGYESSFENWSFRNNFKMYSTLACAPASPARQIRSWSSSLHCNRCVKPHSTSHFLANWNKAGDPCHQPDLANLHGFYQGPGSYKVTKKLLPVFSASKSQGYADILYPSIWGWDDPQRFRYAPNKDYPAPDYANKSNNLFWRGPASEGYSRSGEWRTFLRQRFVWMTGKGKQLLPIYLPVSKDSDKYVVKNIARSQLLKDPSLENSGLAVDTGFTLINQAEEEDKVYELKVFGTAEMEDFQANWQHKYLMSMDESSASRSFISLVQSNALPFRATIFREWFDDRLAAWKHFVPIDLRLHGLWSTLAYFGGRFGTIRSIEGMDAGEFIAESGRKWGSRTLRRDDMEIYLFRLLLEWGRMIDDERDQLGFELMASDTM